MRMNAQDQTPVSPGTFRRCVVCPVGAAAYRNKSTRNPLGLRAAGERGGCARATGTDVKVRAVCRGEALPDVFCRSFQKVSDFFMLSRAYAEI